MSKSTSLCLFLAILGVALGAAAQQESLQLSNADGPDRAEIEYQMVGLSYSPVTKITVYRSPPYAQVFAEEESHWLPLSDEDLRGLDTLLGYYRGKRPPLRCAQLRSRRIAVEWFRGQTQVGSERHSDNSCRGPIRRHPSSERPYRSSSNPAITITIPELVERATGTPPRVGAVTAAPQGPLRFTDPDGPDRAEIEYSTSSCFHHSPATGIAIYRDPPRAQVFDGRTRSWLTLSEQDLRGLDRLLDYYRGDAPPPYCTKTSHRNVTVKWFRGLTQVGSERHRDDSCSGPARIRFRENTRPITITLPSLIERATAAPQ